MEHGPRLFGQPTCHHRPEVYPGIGEAEAGALLRPILGEMDRLGGSHAQQDVLEQVFLDSALKAQSVRDARMIMQRVAGRHPVPPSRRRGYAMAAGMLSGGQ